MVLGCSSPVRCESADQVLATNSGDTLTCRDVELVQGWMELLGGRPLQHGGEGRLPGELTKRFESDPGQTRALVAEVRAAGAAIESVPGMPGAALRAHAVWQAHSDKGVIRSEHGDLWNTQRDALSVWTWDNTAELALTESDIEGWLTYASLCREVQQAGVLRISVADRVAAYQVLVDRFEGGSREERLALASVGPFWGQIKDRWQGAPYERQQKWIGAAPLPPPMTSTSLGYLQAVLEQSVVQHATVLHEVMGPFSLNRGPRVFDE